MYCIEQVLQDGVTVAQTLAALQKREKQYAGKMSFRQRGDFVCKKFPELAQKTLELAEDMFRGQMVLPGCNSKSFVGNPPLWKVNPYNHNEYTFHLNRMNHWNPMLEAYSMTGDKRFAEKVLAELTDWVEQCPRPPLTDTAGNYRLEQFEGLGQWRALECGIRPYRTWAFVIEHLIDSGLITEDILEVYLISLYEHGEILNEISPRLWPKADHNHFLMENLGLLSLSCMFPELRYAQEWKQNAIERLCRCMENQVDELGAQIEGCPSYHTGCVFWFAMLFVYADKYGFQLPDSYRERFQRMFNHGIYITRPCGGNAPWGDGSTTTGTLADSAVSSFMALGDLDYFMVAQQFYPFDKVMDAVREQVWRVRDVESLYHALALTKGKSQTPNLDLMHYNPHLQHVYMRSSWESDALSLLFACRTPIQNLHAHIDPCGFDFSAYGRPLVVDPGKYTYKECDERRLFKTSGWHSMLTVNNCDAWEYISSWKYGPQQQGGITATGRDNSLMWAIASHSNYHPAQHTRSICLVEGLFVVIVDRLEGLRATDTVQVNFHIDNPFCAIQQDNNCVYSVGDSANVTISATSNACPTLVPAKVSDVNDLSRNSVIARFCYPPSNTPSTQDCRQLFAFVMVPSRAGQPSQSVQHLTATLTEGSVVVSFALGKKSYALTVSETAIILNQ